MFSFTTPNTFYKVLSSRFYKIRYHHYNFIIKPKNQDDKLITQLTVTRLVNL